MDNTSRKYIPDNYNGTNATMAYSQSLDYKDCSYIGGWKGYELQALPKSAFQGAILVKSFSTSLMGWSTVSPSYYLNIHSIISEDKILRVDVTTYTGNWKNYNFQIYSDSLYIFCDKNEDTTATLKVVYLP